VGALRVPPPGGPGGEMKTGVPPKFETCFFEEPLDDLPYPEMAEGQPVTLSAVRVSQGRHAGRLVCCRFVKSGSR
jgi:hypothetical protein